MRRSQAPIEPVVKVRDVALTVEETFELFTAGIGRWWPVATHSIGGARCADVRFEGRIGGRVIETTEDGAEHQWADVIAWDPPHRFAMTWHPSIDPVAASIVEVRFESTETGCRLHLEHRGWEEFGQIAGTEARDQYNPGWDGVLGYFTDRSS